MSLRSFISSSPPRLEPPTTPPPVIEGVKQILARLRDALSRSSLALIHGERMERLRTILDDGFNLCYPTVPLQALVSWHQAFQHKVRSGEGVTVRENDNLTS